MARNIFVVGLDDFNLAQLRTVRGADRYCFRGLIPHTDIVNPDHYAIHDLLTSARRELNRYAGQVDAIIGHWDFPTTCLLPLLRAPLGLRGPGLEAVLKCDHKYWSRLMAEEAIPGANPAFRAVNPFDDASIAALDLSYPFWLKPVVAFSSHLAFRVRNAAELRWAIKAIRAGIGKFAEPYDDILRLGGLGHLPAELGGYMCVAEAAIGGRQCTVEGYVQDGRVQPYAIIDSIRARNRTSFLRYEYPSSLPTGVRARLRDLTVRLVEHIGLDDTTFNVEFFWERSWDSLHLLEINARMSKSHCPLFTLTCGSSHHEVAIDVALGRPVDYPHAHSGYSHAAKFMPRVFHDARVARVPSAAQIKEVGRRFPGTEVHVHVRPGMRLSDLPNQDSYSYEIADVFLGADSRRDLLARYREVMKILDFRFAGLNEAPVEAVASARG